MTLIRRLPVIVALLCATAPAMRFAAEEKPPFRVAWIGTSITGGLQVTDTETRIDVQVNRRLEKILDTRVISRNFAFGGATSFLQVSILKQSVLPWRPDLIIAELGALDQFYSPISLPGIEAFLRVARRLGMPVIAWFPLTAYSPVARRGLVKLAAAYGYPAVDMQEMFQRERLSVGSVTNDGAHPNEFGRREAARALEGVFQQKWHLRSITVPSSPLFSPDLERLHFVPAPINAAVAGSGPRYFDQLGAPLRAARETLVTFSFSDRFLAAIFRLDGPPGRLSLSIDDAEWHEIQVQPAWFLGYVLATDLKDGRHKLRLKIDPRNGRDAILDGFIVNDETPSATTEEYLPRESR
jgi:hypothetical protein